MAETNACPRCGSALAEDAPGGLCAACLLGAGLEDTGASGGDVASAMPTPEELTAILPDLDVLECVGAGGMGAVYRARQKRLDREVAVKILAPDVADSRDFAERFSREARALATLSHPNIVSVHDFGEAGDMVYIVMEFVEGTNLREVMKRGGLDSAQALTIVQKLCDTLQYAHDHGVVHRDIKPENVLLTTKGEIKVVDFGLAKSIRAGSASTATARVMGTPAYMAPEQFEQPETVDHRADIYSLGVLFYELLTGELPLGRFAPPSEKVEIDVRLDEVVLRTLEKERERRYQRAVDVKTDIHAVREGKKTSVEPPTPPAPPVAPKRRGPLYHMGVLAGCFAMLVVGFFLFSTLAAIMIPNLLNAVDRGKQKRTTADLHTISEATEAYRAARGEYPDVDSIEDLTRALVPEFADTLPQLDGWTRPFVVETDGDFFKVGSGGKDGGDLVLVQGGGPTREFQRAIVFVNGKPVQWPEGVGDLPARIGSTRQVGLTFMPLLFFGFLLLVAGIGLVVVLLFWRRRRRRASRS